MANCTHLDQIQLTQLPDAVDGCADCLASESLGLTSGICLECGHVGCCADSPSGTRAPMRARPSTRSSARSSRERTGRGATSTARDAHSRGAGHDPYSGPLRS